MSALRQLQGKLREGEGMLITSAVSRLYLFGIQSSAGIGVVTQSGAALLIDFRYIELARGTVAGADVTLLENEREQLPECLRKNEINTLFLETDSVSVEEMARYRGLLSGVRLSRSPRLRRALSALREIKSAGECDRHAAAQAITDRAFSRLLPLIRRGMTERALRDTLDGLLREEGADDLAFSTIALSGENTSRPHGVPGEREIQDGDFVLLDFGAKKNGYCSDMTRTVAIGPVSDRQRRGYDLVLAAQAAALEVIRAGLSTREADRAARDVIDADPDFRGSFGHSLSHGIGIEIHEEPRCGPRSEGELKAGQIISVEPGVYLAGEFGVRIEDMVKVTGGGCRNFTASPKNLIVL